MRSRRCGATRIWEVSHHRSKPGDDDPEAMLAMEAVTAEVVLWISRSASERFRRAREPLLELIQGSRTADPRVRPLSYVRPHEVDALMRDVARRN